MLRVHWVSEDQGGDLGAKGIREREDSLDRKVHG